MQKVGKVIQIFAENHLPVGTILRQMFFLPSEMGLEWFNFTAFIDKSAQKCYISP